MNSNICSCRGCEIPNCWPQYDSYEIIGYLCPEHLFTHKICKSGKECLPVNEFENNGRSNVCKYHSSPMSTDLLLNELKEDFVSKEKLQSLIDLLKSLDLIPSDYNN